MSAALVRKSLEVVDPNYKTTGKKKKKREIEVPESRKIKKSVGQKSKKVQIDALQPNRKLTVIEARKFKKSKDQVLKENLKKLNALKKACTIELDKATTEMIIKRAVTRRPVKIQLKSNKTKQTAFTEEDFKKFEEEYTG